MSVEKKKSLNRCQEVGADHWQVIRRSESRWDSYNLASVPNGRVLSVATPPLRRRVGSDAIPFAFHPCKAGGGGVGL